MARRVVADAGPLIGLARIDRLSILESVFAEILVPSVVADECRRDLTLPGARAIDAEIERGVLRIANPPEPPPLAAPPGLGPGELAAVELAHGLGIGVLMDDRGGRRFARRLGVPVVGTGGVLLRARSDGKLERVAPIISELVEDGYRLSSALVDELLRRAGER